MRKLRTYPPRVYKNPSEKAFAEMLRDDGWNVVKRGWPDFFCTRMGRVMVVEVKPENRHLKHHQKIIMNWLASLGVDVYEWKPIAGFRKIESVTKPRER